MSSKGVFTSRQEDRMAAGDAGALASEYRISVISQIREVMAERPQDIAVTDGETEWTYGELRTRMGNVAKSLADHGVSRGSVVGMHLPRCADAIAVMLGIMGSGCVYLPLDQAYPADRLRHMLDQAAAAAVISNDLDQDLYGPHRIWLPVPGETFAATGDQPEVPVDSTVADCPYGPKDYAYILFTSGSTGKPKGVMVTHENITLMNNWSADVLGVTSFDSTATTCSLSFDPSFHEVLLPLSAGGTVHVIPHALALGQLARPVSLIATTPKIANELLQVGQLPSLRVLMLGGEPLAADVAARIVSSGRVQNLFNCYGPTECTACVTVAEVSAPVPTVIPIGRPVPGVDILILDADGYRLPDGETGEICIFGRQVADGYVNDPRQTGERFVIGPAGEGNPTRYYRTGDLGHRAADGMIYFAGRLDRQVKINGHRVELGEIDAALRSHPRVFDAATIARDDERLVAYVVPAEPDVGVDTAELKDHLAASLPRFMVPAGIVVLAELPKTVSGKLDDAALPAWSASRREDGFSSAGDFDEATSRVIKIVADVTGFAGQIRPTDDFIADLGGTSLGIVRVLAELDRDAGQPIRINDALADTSVAGLARLLRGKTVSSPADFALNTEGVAAPVFMIHAYLGGMLGLRRLAGLLPTDQPVYGLQVYPESEQQCDSVTITALAQSAVKRIREIQPTGRVTMLGQSGGGLIAFEAARALAQSEGTAPRVLLLDTACHRGALGYRWGEAVLNRSDIVPNYTKALIGMLGRLRRAGGPRRASSAVLPQAGDLMSLNQRQLASTADAVRNYKGSAYDGDITVLCTRQGRIMAAARPSLGWSSVVRGAIRVVVVPGSHLTMVDEPHVHVLAGTIGHWLDADLARSTADATTGAHGNTGSGEHQPLLAVDQLARGVEVPGVAGRLGDHVQQQLPEAIDPP